MPSMEVWVVLYAWGDLNKDEDGEDDEPNYKKSQVQGVYFSEEEAVRQARRQFADAVLNVDEADDLNDESLQEVTQDYETCADDDGAEVCLTLERISEDETDDAAAQKTWVEPSVLVGKPPGYQRIDGVDEDEEEEEEDDEEGNDEEGDEQPDLGDEEDEDDGDEDEYGEEPEVIDDEEDEPEEEVEEAEDEDEEEEDVDDGGEELIGHKRLRDDGDEDEDEEEEDDQ